MSILLFPGQGSQKACMGNTFFFQDNDCVSRIDLISDLLKLDFESILKSKDPSVYSKTRYSQLILFFYQYSMARTISKIDLVAAHSMGEFAAIAVANVLSFEDVLNLVNKRALFTNEICERVPSRMAAIVGMMNSQVEFELASIRSEGFQVYVANYNGDGQLVITGCKEGIRKAVSVFKVLGAKRAVILPISGSFHSPLMTSANDKLIEEIDKLSFKDSEIPIIQSFSGRSTMDSNRIKENLKRHLISGVKWTDAMQELAKYEGTDMVEIGPDETLTKMLRRVNDKLLLRSVWQGDNMSNFVETEFLKN